MKSIHKIYQRIEKLLSTKNMTWLAFAIFLITLLPIGYLSFVNRATGDDYGYGTYTRAAWRSSHSLIQVAKAISVTIKQYYDGWQGTWFSIALFAVQPEVFGDKSYVIVAFMMLFFWIGSTMLLFSFILRKMWGFDKWSYGIVTLVYLFVGIQFIPSTKSSIFWYNGCAHYLIPFAMCQLMVWLLLHYIREFQVKYFVFITLIATLLGGSNYQAALFALIVLVYAGCACLIQKKNHKVFFLAIPFSFETIGLIISMMAPGNKVRGGEDFGFSVSKIVGTILSCFVEGVRTIITYFQEKPVIFIGLFVMFLFMLEAFSQKPYQVKKLPASIMVLALLCLYFAMQAPALYAAVGVSGGVGNMNYLTFLLSATGILAIFANKIVLKCKGKAVSKKVLLSDRIHGRIVLPGLFACLILAFLCRSNLKSSTSWISMDYITSGQAKDYKEQMDLQTILLTDGEIKDVIVPFINDEQGPLMHMPVTDNPDAWTNTVTRDFYGKNSVVAMERPKWVERYGEGR